MKRQKEGRQRLLFLVVFAALSVLLTGVGTYCAAHRPYVPPKRESAAQSGEPSPPEDCGYSTVDARGVFTVKLASRWVRRENGALPVWFTNPAGNGVYLLLRLEREGRVLYESGLLSPGEYVEALTPGLFPPDAGAAEAKIYSFEPETYYSRGTVVLPGRIE